jgi:quinol monooxygenase YgiN
MRLSYWAKGRKVGPGSPEASFLRLIFLEDLFMAKFALYARLKPKAGKAADVETFLKQGAQMAAQEKGTVNWYALKQDDGQYSIFDTFEDEAGRDAHLNGDIAKALMSKWSELFEGELQISKIGILAEK